MVRAALEGIKLMKNTFSAAHERYLKKEKKKKASVHIARAALLIAILLIWEALAYSKAINSFITSSPSRIFKTLYSLFREEDMLYHIGVTLKETLIGFFISMLSGLIFALVLWWNDFIRKVAEPYIVVLNALPKIALGPLIIIWCGTGQSAIITMTFLVCVVVATMNLLSGFMRTGEGKILLLRSMGASKAHILLKLVLPSSLPTVISTLKINVGMAWIGSIMGEYIVSKAGIGYLIVYGGQVFRLDLVMSSVAVLCFLAAGMYALVALAEKKLVKNSEK